jgi:hypothetical protein
LVCSLRVFSVEFRRDIPRFQDDLPKRAHLFEIEVEFLKRRKRKKEGEEEEEKEEKEGKRRF